MLTRSSCSGVSTPVVDSNSNKGNEKKLRRARARKVRERFVCKYNPEHKYDPNEQPFNHLFRCPDRPYLEQIIREADAAEEPAAQSDDDKFTAEGQFQFKTYMWNPKRISGYAAGSQDTEDAFDVAVPKPKKKIMSCARMRTNVPPSRSTRK